MLLTRYQKYRIRDDLEDPWNSVKQAQKNDLITINKYFTALKLLVPHLEGQPDELTRRERLGLLDADMKLVALEAQQIAPLSYYGGELPVETQSTEPPPMEMW